MLFKIYYVLSSRIVSWNHGGCIVQICQNLPVECHKQILTERPIGTFIFTHSAYDIIWKKKKSNK